MTGFYRSCLALAAAASIATPQIFAQSARPTRNGAGVRAGLWSVRDTVAQQRVFSKSPLVEAYFQKELDEHLALESSVGLWMRKEHEIQQPTGNQIETRTYVVPLLTGLKVYPLTVPGTRLEPFLLGGLGFVLGIVDVSGNAIGGGGTSIQTGFGMKGATGVELKLTTFLGLSSSVHYQWIRFADELGNGGAFKGFGVEGGLTYRSQL